MKIDQMHINILRHLRDGRKSFKAIADALHIAENTVRARVARLIDEGMLDISGLVNPQRLPGHKLIIVGVKLATMDLVSKGKDFSRLKGVVNVSVVTGRYDLILTVLINEDFDLLEFYTHEVTKVAHVLSAETFVVYHGYGNRVPYVL